MERIKSIEQLQAIEASLAAARKSDRPVVTVCGGIGCTANGCQKLVAEFKKLISEKNLGDKVELLVTGCLGFCEMGPVVVVYPQKTFYKKVQVADAAEILDSAVSGKAVERLLYTDAEGKKIEKEDDIPFYKNQNRKLTGILGVIDPESIESYLAAGGYQALAKVLSGMKPEDVINDIIKSGLRGRGGGGFPTGKKWESCRKAADKLGASKRYVICNADEGDPGAFMDEAVLQGNPHTVIEGMLIGAFAIGSDEGIVYVRNEYPLAIKSLSAALEEAREAGLLGKNILGTDFSFDIRINRGGGAFVCGESSALIASIEGFVGEPRAKHIHMAESGLNDKPTVLNNVETWANVPLIIKEGVSAFTAIGTGDVSENPWNGSKGTKIFSLAGKVNNTGLVEVPMGATLRDIIFGVGGGIKNGKKFKAVQTGGPSGGCIPEKFLDMPVDFDELSKVGSMMGSGGMVVLDEDSCMVDFAKYFVEFLCEESCGKCTTCREGLRRLKEILTRITEGKGRADDLDLIEDVCETLSQGSLCALGGSAANPVLSTLRHFREEYEAHIFQKKCPGKVCKSLIKFSINDNCTGCTVCAKNCPQGCISGARKEKHVIDSAKCIKCGVCKEVCKFGAVTVE